MDLSFCPLASGSSGNATYIKSGDTKVLVDAGLSGVRIEKALQNIGADANGLDAIFVTHAHTDHISGIGVLSRRYNIPIFASTGTWEAIEEKGCIGKIDPIHKRYVHLGEKETFKDLIVDPFPISHDCYEPTGYSFSSENYKASVATDLGIVTDVVKEHLSDSQVILLEANHDINMLETGPYPYFLKERVGGIEGHLSNVACGQLIKDLLVDVSTEKPLKTVYLGHLSTDNNTPQVAYDAVDMIIRKEKEEKSMNLHVAGRHDVSQLTRLTQCAETGKTIDFSELSDNDSRQIRLFAD